MTSSDKWVILPSGAATSFQIEANQLLKINDLEFAKYDSQLKCVQKYDTIDNKWSKWIQNDGFSHVGGCVTFALNQNILSAYTNGRFIVMNTEQNTYITYDTNDWINCPDTLSAIINIDNKLHIIGGFGNKHLIWNEQKSQFDVKNEIELSLRHVLFHRLIYLKSKNILLSIGGLYSGNASDTIYSFDIALNKWSKLKQKLPIVNCLFGCITTRNDKYIILFGGRGINDKHNNIYILNTKTMTFRESEICCPNSGIIQAINMNSKERELVLVFGYIKQLWNANEFNNLINLPFYLINIIRQYVVIEMIHLIHGNSGNHWRINVDEIITRLI